MRAPRSTMAAAILLAACTDSALAAMPERIIVAPEAAPCSGVGPMTCLQVKRPGELDWRLHYSGIEGFSHEPGVASLLLLRERRIDRPPADATDRVWVLEETIARDSIPKTPSGVLESLRGTGWRLRLVEPGGKFGEAWRSSGLTLTFDATSGRIAGYGGCNRWFGAWSVEGDGSLASKPFGSTQMACPEPQMAIEAAYLGLLTSAASLHWWGTELGLVADDGTRLLYEQLLE